MFNSLLSFFVAAVEFIDTTGGIDEFLFTGKEGVALGADTDFVFRTGGLDVPDFAASAGNGGIAVSGMDILFHVLLLTGFIKNSDNHLSICKYTPGIVIFQAGCAKNLQNICHILQKEDA